MSALTYNTTTEARRKLADLCDKAHGRLTAREEGRARERSGHLPRSLSSRPENTAKQESRKRLKAKADDGKRMQQAMFGLRPRCLTVIHGSF